MHRLLITYLDGSQSQIDADAWNYDSTYFVLELLDDDGKVEQTIYQVNSFRIL